MSLIRPIFLFLVFLAIASRPLPAQEKDGHVAVEKSGFALVKPQPWSSPSQASPLKFTAYTDRSARGTAGAGYFVFRVPNQNDRQIPVAQIVKVVPQPEVPNNISTQAECDLIKKAVADFRALSKAYPIAKTFIDEMIKPLEEEVVKFESGQIKIEGVWKSKAEVVRQELASYEVKLKQEFYANENPAVFELESNIYYTKLLEFAKNDPQLGSRLKALKLLNQVQLAETIELQFNKGRALIEAQFAPPQDFEKPPVLSPEARNVAQKLAQSFEEFKSSAPPAAIKVPVEAVKAVILIYEKLPSICSSLQAKDYLAANTALAALVDPSTKIGTHTRELIIGLQTLTTTKVASFTKLRDEAAALQKEGKSKPALAKYQEALAIMPSSQVSAEISRISQPEPPKKK